MTKRGLVEFLPFLLQKQYLINILYAQLQENFDNHYLLASAAVLDDVFIVGGGGENKT